MYSCLYICAREHKVLEHLNDDVLCRVRVFLYAYIFGWRADYPILFLDFHEKLIVKITRTYKLYIYIYSEKDAEN